MAVTPCNMSLCKNYVGIELQALIYDMTRPELVAEFCDESFNEV
jgi:hypothetical protein